MTATGQRARERPDAPHAAPLVAPYAYPATKILFPLGPTAIALKPAPKSAGPSYDAAHTFTPVSAS